MDGEAGAPHLQRVCTLIRCEEARASVLSAVQTGLAGLAEQAVGVQE
jgi:hypothetical protein